jgi:phasin family protein
MNKTQFQLPPRNGSAVDHWMTRDAAAPEPRWADPKMALASGTPTEMLASMKFPFMFDMAALLAAHCRNMEAITAANRIVREGVQAVARRNLEIMRQAIDGISERMQTMGSPECPRDRAMRQTESAIKAYEDTTANMRELGETIQHANAEAMKVLGRRFAEATDEVKSLARYATSSFWDTETKPSPFWQQT